MCGIAGLIELSGPARSPEELGRLLAPMVSRLAPRGPDGQGDWLAPGVALGHRRLKVIDLSEAASQPMASEDGQVQVVFNGEIYNFADLRAELRGLGHRFRTRSDTEVLVEGYRAWGDDLVERLQGMFAFGLWDGQRRRLLAARDRLGKKPFYYAELSPAGAPPLFAFASELKGLLALPELDRTVDAQALSDYLTFEYVPAPRTILRSARKLDAGELLVLEVPSGGGPARPAIRRYWDLTFPAEHPPWKEEDAAAELRTLLRRAVERRLVGDVPLGVFLSGGIDSSTVAAFMAEIAGADRIKTFSVSFSDPSFDESAHARLVANHLGTDHHDERLDPAAMLSILPEVTDFLDEPLADASIVPTYLLSRFTRQHVTVALGGDGGDELFSGYPTFQADLPGRLYFDRLPAVARRWVARAAEQLPASTAYFSPDFKLHQFLRGGSAPGPRRHQRWMASFLPEEQTRLLRPEISRHLQDPLAALDARAGHSSAVHQADRLLDFYAHFYLAGDVNVKVDRAAGAVGLEVRAPFQDVDLVSFACQLPPSLRRRRLTSKYVLKRALRGKLPESILHRRKQGFGVPVARWMKEDLRPALLDELAPDKIRREGFFDPDVVCDLIADHLGGRRDRRKALWTLFTFERWLTRWCAR